MATVYGWVPQGVARMCGNDQIMDHTAHTLYTLARARAERHRLTGMYISKLSVKNVPGKKGVRDRLVIAGDSAAVSIEYGHTVRIKRKDIMKNGPEYRWVPGQYILTGAIAEMPGYNYTSFGRLG